MTGVHSLLLANICICNIAEQGVLQLVSAHIHRCGVVENRAVEIRVSQSPHR